MSVAAESGTIPTPRELRVLAVYGRLGTYRATARHLGISKSTVRDSLANVRSRLGTGRTIQAYEIALAEGMFTPETDFSTVDKAATLRV